MSDPTTSTCTNSTGRPHSRSLNTLWEDLDFHSSDEDDEVVSDIAIPKLRRTQSEFFDRDFPTHPNGTLKKRSWHHLSILPIKTKKSGSPKHVMLKV